MTIIKKHTNIHISQSDFAHHDFIEGQDISGVRITGVFSDGYVELTYRMNKKSYRALMRSEDLFITDLEKILYGITCSRSL